jgi:hypothetical protein
LLAGSWAAKGESNHPVAPLTKHTHNISDRAMLLPLIHIKWQGRVNLRAVWIKNGRSGSESSKNPIAGYRAQVIVIAV